MATPIDKAGYLKKKTVFNLKGFGYYKRRWVVLKDHKLFYYHDEDTCSKDPKNFKGCIDLKSITGTKITGLEAGLNKFNPQTKDGCQFEMIKPGRIYFWTAASKHECNEWVTAILSQSGSIKRDESVMILNKIVKEEGKAGEDREKLTVDNTKKDGKGGVADDLSDDMKAKMKMHSDIAEKNKDKSKELTELEAKMQLGLRQMISGAEQHLRGVTPDIKLASRADAKHYYDYRWATEGSVQVTEFAFQLVGTGDNVTFSEGLGTYIEFVASWKPASDGNTEFSLDKFVTVASQTGVREPTNMPAKKFLVSAEGEFIQMTNPQDLVDFTFDLLFSKDATLSALPPAEKEEVKKNLIKTSGDAVLQATVDELKLLWCSWVQCWAHEVRGKSKEDNPHFLGSDDHFDKDTVNMGLELVGDSVKAVDSVKKMVESAMAAGFEDDKDHPKFNVKVLQKMIFEVIFEPEMLRPHLAGYRKSTDSEISLGSEQSNNSALQFKRFIIQWSDLEDMLDPDYLRFEFQQALEIANQMHSVFKSAGKNTKKS